MQICRVQVPENGSAGGWATRDAASRHTSTKERERRERQILPSYELLIRHHARAHVHHSFPLPAPPKVEATWLSMIRVILRTRSEFRCSVPSMNGIVHSDHVSSMCFRHVCQRRRRQSSGNETRCCYISPSHSARLERCYKPHTPLTHHSHTRTRTHSHTPLWERSRCKVQQQDGRREAAAGEGKLLRDSALLYNITLPTVHSSQSHHHHQSPSSSVWLLPLSHPSHTASASTSGRMVSWCSALKSFVDRSIAPSVSCPLMFGMSAGFCQQKKKQVTVRAHLSAAAAATTAPYSLQGWAD